MISMSCRPAWNTFSTFSSAMSSNMGARSRPGASASTAKAPSSSASCTTQSFGQKVVSRRNSVSTVTNSERASRWQAALRSAVLVTIMPAI
jgi:hypothetical protein